MPEVEDHFIGADTLLPRGDEMSRCHVMAYICDASRDVMDRAHTIQILYTRMYQVEFAGGKATELTANIIAESIYTQCDPNGNEFLLLDLLIIIRVTR